MDANMIQTAIPLPTQFSTTLDNVQTDISNSKVFADTIQNFSAAATAARPSN